MQSWDLNKKIMIAQTRILEWYKLHDGKAYVSFSGGKDSTVLADIAAKICKANDYELVLWFCDTGLEFPEIKVHVKQFAEWLKEKYEINVNLVIDYPKDKKTGNRISFKDVILQNGYPIVSKEVAKCVQEAKIGLEVYNGTKYVARIQRLNGEFLDKDGNKSKYNMKKWKFLLDAPFKISDKCCDIMKKKPAARFRRQTKLYPIIGVMADESQLRKQQWLRHGCNYDDGKNPSSKPLSIWTEQDVLQYIVKYNLPIAPIYGDIVEVDGKLKTTKADRTGCVFCGFGCTLEKEPNRFQRLKTTHPKLWEYCMKPISEGGLGMKEVLEFLNVKIQ